MKFQAIILKICQAAPLTCSIFFTILIVPFARKSKWNLLKKIHRVLSREAVVHNILFFSFSRYTTYSRSTTHVVQATKHTTTCPHWSLSYCFKEATEVKSALWEGQTHPTYPNEMKVCRKSLAKRQAEVWMRRPLLLSFTPPQAYAYQLTPLPWPKTTFFYMSTEMDIPHTQKLQMKAHGNPMYNNILLWRSQWSSIQVWLASSNT